MKQAKWTTPNRMLFESEHNTFNRQVDTISTGNVWGRVQTSGFIRPYTEQKCNGFTSPPGDLRRFDLGLFPHLPQHVREYVIRETKADPIILYEFHHYNGRTKITHGYIVTTTDHKLMRHFITGPTWKSQGVIQEASKYIADCDHPPTRLYSWTASDGVQCVTCCNCGEVLRGGLE
jgi:hypothetical protein